MRRHPRSIALILVSIVLLLSLQLGQWRSIAAPASAGLPTFPGAAGFGTETIAGRRGRVVFVTNLQDQGVGSLRAAIELAEPRTIVFQVSGTIVLQTSLEIRHPFVTIAGQTAPAGGITLRNGAGNGATPLKIKTHDVVIRYLRSRPGSSEQDTGNLDALAIAGPTGAVYNVVIDHCSFSWATDELVSTFYDAHDVTIQWSILSEGLDCATHVERGERQCHSMGLLLGSERSHHISIHHNLFAHNRRRNPLIKNAGITDVVNNVIYNPGFGEDSFAPTQVMGTYGDVQVNYVGNVFQPGVDTGSADWLIDTKAEPVAIYAVQNQVPHHVIQPASRRWLVPQRHVAPAIATRPAAEAYEQVLAQAGASRGLQSTGEWYDQRDAIDRRIIHEVRTGTGQIIDDPQRVGGWLADQSQTQAEDGDRDGMPDAFEQRYGLNPNDAGDRQADRDGNGYWNGEAYLNGTSP